MTYTTNLDGSITFKDEAPANLANYTIDPNNHRHFIPNFIDCRYRLKQVGVQKCGAVSVVWFCNLKGQIVSVPFCNQCDVKDKI